MKTSIFNMTFTLPPMVEMVEVEKDMPTSTNPQIPCYPPVSKPPVNFGC